MQHYPYGVWFVIAVLFVMLVSGYLVIYKFRLTDIRSIPCEDMSVTETTFTCHNTIYDLSGITSIDTRRGAITMAVTASDMPLLLLPKDAVHLQAAWNRYKDSKKRLFTPPASTDTPN